MSGTSSRLLSRLRDVLAEMNQAQRLLVVRRMSLDTYLYDPDSPPSTYAEFVARASGPLRREPGVSE